MRQIPQYSELCYGCPCYDAKVWTNVLGFCNLFHKRLEGLKSSEMRKCDECKRLKPKIVGHDDETEMKGGEDVNNKD